MNNTIVTDIDLRFERDVAKALPAIQLWLRLGGRGLYPEDVRRRFPARVLGEARTRAEAEERDRLNDLYQQIEQERRPA
ncbi:MAG: hypothetical protein LAP40_23520 [Acidobacteriia bacterium]|nr:hypothetical protein [Terriglobia bacterium]